jgi:hypothetical protein
MRMTLLSLVLAAAIASHAAAQELPTTDGYRGIWYANTAVKNQYAWKYSGGMATYPQQHEPIAIYSKEANKTFFVFGGVAPDKPRELLHMVAHYDHATGMVCRPRILLNKKTEDAHDNPVLSIDGDGYLYVFSNSHGTGRPSFIHRSLKPYSIDAFEKVYDGNFSYGQPWFVEGLGFTFLHTHYDKAGEHYLFWYTSANGRNWSERMPLAAFGKGHYQISWRAPDGRVATAFDYHPKGLDSRTNLYYIQTRDGGKTFETVDGKPLQMPLKDANNPALVRDFEKEGQLVYLKDLNFDADGRPVILFLNCPKHLPGPESGPRVWRTARYLGEGKGWEYRDFTTSDHNYDHGSLDVDGHIWSILAPTEPAAQAGMTGGEMVLWRSADAGKTWLKFRQVTSNSPRNHTYARRPLDAQLDFAFLWADGDGVKPSECNLYFTSKSASSVWRLPPRMQAENERPQRLEPGP